MRCKRLCRDADRLVVQGTFLVRPGLSLAGCLVVSAVVQGGGCRHMALDSAQLDSRSLEVSGPCLLAAHAMDLFCLDGYFKKRLQLSQFQEMQLCTLSCIASVASLSIISMLNSGVL